MANRRYLFEDFQIEVSSFDAGNHVDDERLEQVIKVSGAYNTDVQSNNTGLDPATVEGNLIYFQSKIALYTQDPGSTNNEDNKTINGLTSTSGPNTGDNNKEKSKINERSSTGHTLPLSLF